MAEETLRMPGAQNSPSDRQQEISAPCTIPSPELSTGNQVGGREIKGMRPQGNTELPTVLLWEESEAGGGGSGSKGASDRIQDKQPSMPSSSDSGSISPSNKGGSMQSGSHIPEGSRNTNDSLENSGTEKSSPNWDKISKGSPPSAGTMEKPEGAHPNDAPAKKANVETEIPFGFGDRQRRTAHNGETVAAKWGDEVIAEKGSTVFAEDGAKVTAKDGSWVSAKNGAEVIAKDGSIVHAEDGSHVTAKDGSKVFANKGSKVVARDGSYVEAGEGSEVRAQDGSNVSALKGSGVQAEYGSHVEACDGSTVHADAGSDVNAWKGSLVIADKDSTVTKKDEGAKIYLEQGAELRDESK